MAVSTPSSPGAISSPGSLDAADSQDRRELVATRMEHELEGQAPALLTRAAINVVARKEASAETLGDVLHARALRYYAEGLRQYLAIRLGNDAARDVLEQIRDQVSQLAPGALVQAPGPRARLYRLAHECVSGPVDPALPAWRVPDDARLASALGRLRGSLPSRDLSLLELRHARELRPIEVAFVLDESVDEILVGLQKATSRAHGILASVGGGDPLPLRKVLIAAFALEPDGGIELSDAMTPLGVEPLPLGRVIGGRYAIQARVGTGAFGDVYRAEDTEVPGHVVALKLLHEPSYSGESRQNALRELRHIASVFHPSVVQFKDHGWFEDRLWFVMPWYDGETLASRLERVPLTRHEAHRLFVPLAQALAAVHKAGLRHQDVKPDNIFLAELPGFSAIHPVLIDLGVSATDAEMLVAGTPTYFSPEVAAQYAIEATERPRVTAKADVFSLALSLRNALDPDLRADIPAGAVEAFIEDRAGFQPTPDELPRGRDLGYLQGHFARWLARDPAERPSAERFASELSILVAPEAQRKRRRRLLRWLVPTTIALGTTFGGISAALHARAVEEELVAREAQERAERTAADLAASREENAQTRNAFDRVSATASELRDALAETEATLSARTEERDHARARAAALGSERDSLSAERDALTRARDAALAAQESTAGELAGVESALGEAERTLEALRAEKSSLEEELARGADESRALRARLTTERAARESTQGRLDAVEAELASTAATAASLRAELRAAQTRSDRLQSLLEDAERAIGALQRPAPPPSPTSTDEP